MNIPAKFGQNWPSDFGEEDCNVKGLQTTYNKDDGLKSDDNSSHDHWITRGRKSHAIYKLSFVYHSKQ